MAGHLRGMAKRLAVELSELSFQHALALRDATFFGMTKPEARDFDRRRKRISGVYTMLGKLKAGDLI
jgi:hypothetical protein